MRNRLLTLLLLCCPLWVQAQRWQQRADYTMDVSMDANTHRFDGKQRIVYTNNSPDTLDKVFYHLYFNAFQPNSMMDVRSRSIEDPDSRVRDRISRLSPEEIGYQKVRSLKQNGKEVQYRMHETILEVVLDKPILPKGKAVFEMDFQGQVPVQIRRAGRNSSEGVAYSMAQWYPKLAEYDHQGWHTNPYIAREFYGIWGDYDVKLTLPADFVVAATGYLQNAKEVGHGYEGIQQGKPKDGKLTWHFKAPNVHDFTWAADPEYTHMIRKCADGPEMHFFWKKNQGLSKDWEALPDYMEKTFRYMNQHYGRYPYDVYSFVQGGDGGMEYGMLTLVTGKRSLGSLVGVCVHELVHSWFQFVLANNESLYPWMDEGFNTYAGNEVERYLGMVPSDEDPHAATYSSYFMMARSGKEEAMSTHADHYDSNRAYSVNAYAKGGVFVHQLGYVIGQQALNRTMKRYYDTWKFRHPNDNDFIRVAEKESGLQLDWYKEYFVYTTKQVDYGIKQVKNKEGEQLVTLERVGKMPMPIDLQVTYRDGRKEWIYIPMNLMFGEKPAEDDLPRQTLQPWPWTHPTYSLKLKGEVSSIEIDPSRRMADIDRKNNVYTFDLPFSEGPGI